MKFQEITNSVDLLYLLNKLYPEYDCHVIAIDKLKDIKHKMNQIIIINYQNSQQNGNHWVHITCIESKYVVYFDSYANDPPKPILDYLLEYKSKGIVKNIVMMTDQIQKLTEDSCGWYVLHYVKNYVLDRKPAYMASVEINYKNTIAYGKMLFNKYLKKR